MRRFEGVDFVESDLLLTEEEKLMRDTARKFVEDKVKPIIEEYHRGHKFPIHLVKEMGTLGFLGSNLKGYDFLPGISNVGYGLIMQELERGDSALRSFASVQGALVMYPILTFGSEEQKSKWLPLLASGEKIGCFGLTEPDFGSNPAGMKTTAKKVGSHYILNGSKMWITNGSIADIAVVFAKLEDGNIGGFIVERGMEGFKQVEIKNKFSLRASDTGILYFEDCKVPLENKLPGTKGLKSALMCLTQARYGIGWGVLGPAMECFHIALEYSKERIQFAGKPIASHQLVQEKLVYMLSEITKAQLLSIQVGRLKDEGKAHFSHISLLKKNNVKIAREIAKLSREILGASGIVDDYPVIRHMLNLESVFTYEGTDEIHTLIIGHRITDIPAYY